MKFRYPKVLYHYETKVNFKLYKLFNVLSKHVHFFHQS